MDESWLQTLIAKGLRNALPKSQVEEENVNTYDIRVTTPDGKVFLVQITEEEF